MDMPVIAMVEPGKLKAHPRNPRIHDPAMIEKLVKSIKYYGWTNPVIANRAGEVLAGNARLKAALKLKIAKVPVIYVDLTPEQEEAYIIADNKIASMSTWQAEALREGLMQLNQLKMDLRHTGMSLTEIDETIGRTEREASTFYYEEKIQAEQDGLVGSKIEKDGNWFYVEWPDDEAEEYNKVVAILEEAGGMNKRNEIDQGVFLLIMGGVTGGS